MALSRNAGRVTALIPARGGSKGIPRKNLVEVAGRPLIAWSISAALEASSVDRVVVSTDDPEIAEVARRWGAEVPFLRPPALAEDTTPDHPVFLHFLDRSGAAEDPELLVHLRPTSPVRPAGLIDAAVSLLFEAADADSLRSVSPAPKTPYKMWRVEDGRLAPLLGSWSDELFNRPRQSLPTVWVHDGVIDVVRSSTVRAGSMSGREIVPFLTPAGVAVDIDEPADLEVAASLLRHAAPEDR